MKFCLLLLIALSCLNYCSANFCWDIQLVKSPQCGQTKKDIQYKVIDGDNGDQGDVGEPGKKGPQVICVLRFFKVL